MRFIAYGWVLLLLAVVAGCKEDVRATLPDPTQGITVEDGNAGYLAYVDAAKMMEDRGSKYIGRTTWSPDQKDAIVAAARDPIAKIKAITDARFGKTWTEITGPRPHTRGWRTIGRALTWRIESALRDADNAAAIESFMVAVRMGNALATSDAHDAHMGLEIVDNAINALWPGLPKFGAGELNGLSSRLREAMQGSPGHKNAIAQETAVTLAGAAWVQDRYEKREFSTISETLGVSVEPAVKELRKLAGKQASEQQAYFNEFVDEMKDEMTTYEKRLASSPSEWEDEPKMGTRAWQRFTKAFATTWKVYVEHRAVTRTRLRVIAIDAALLAGFKLNASVPRTLAGFPRWLRTDPFAGRDLAYVPRGVDYKLYSIGPDRKDNGGDSGDLGIDR
jgi:hypothetical protein